MQTGGVLYLVSFNSMFLNSTSAWQDWLPRIPPPTATPPIQQDPLILSHIEPREQRIRIRALWVADLVHFHNTLIGEILGRGRIAETERGILLALWQEWTDKWWFFFWKIQEVGWVHRIPHTDWMARFNLLTGNTESLSGESRLQLWGLSQDNATPVAALPLP